MRSPVPNMKRKALQFDVSGKASSSAFCSATLKYLTSSCSCFGRLVPSVGHGKHRYLLDAYLQPAHGVGYRLHRQCQARQECPWTQDRLERCPVDRPPIPPWPSPGVLRSRARSILPPGLVSVPETPRVQEKSPPVPCSATSTPSASSTNAPGPAPVPEAPPSCETGSGR